MTKPFIVVGDSTSHGGKVIQGAPTTDIDGKAIARVGDKVTCPKKGCHSPTTIVTSGDVTILIDGKPVALHGDKTACGATLISSQVGTNSDPNGGSAVDSTFSSMSVNKASSLNAHDEEILEQWFSLEDEDGNPVSGYCYDLYKDNELHTHSSSYDGGNTSSIKGEANLTVVTWLKNDSAGKA